MKLTVDVPQEPVEVYGDPTRLAQVVANLLGNAAKFTQRDGRIELRAAVESATPTSEACLVISVRDNGSGISAGATPSVFDVFVKRSREGGEKVQGLGIGLHLGRSFVELHGGTVEARSAGPGRGSEFVVRLPAARGAAVAAAPERTPKSLATVPVSAPARELHRLLVVDDIRTIALGLPKS